MSRMTCERPTNDTSDLRGRREGAAIILRQPRELAVFAWIQLGKGARSSGAEEVDLDRTYAPTPSDWVVEELCPERLTHY